jgi:hypothetical protein
MTEADAATTDAANADVRIEPNHRRIRGMRRGVPVVEIGDVTHDDIAWGYRTPLPESAGIAGLVCFYNDRVDLEVDGVVQPRLSDRPR